MNTATKTDLAELRTETQRLFGDVHKAISAQTWKIISATLGCGALLASAVYYIARNVQP